MVYFTLFRQFWKVLYYYYYYAIQALFKPSVSCYYSIAFVILQLSVRELPFTEHNPLFEWFYNARVSLHVKLGVEVFPQEIIIFFFFLFRKIRFIPTQSLLTSIFGNNFGERRVVLVTIAMVHWERAIRWGWLFSTCLGCMVEEGEHQTPFLWRHCALFARD